MSFRNINAKSFIKDDREDHSRSPATTKRNKTQANRVDNSIGQLETPDPLATQNSNLLEAFRLER
jgi:hypothetical protein